MSGAKIHCLYDELVDPKTLKNHKDNRNKHPPEQIERLAKILEYQGWRYAIKVSKRTKSITSGHGRKLAALDRGWKLVPVVYQDYESEEQEYADVQADNAIALWAELDLPGINSDIGLLGPDFDIDLLGIKNFTMDVADKEFEADEDEVPEARPEPKVVRGEVYILGNHRLMCGDSTSITDVERLMNGEKADMVFTDPPYGMKYNASGWANSNSPTYKKQRAEKNIKNSKHYHNVIGDHDDFTPDLINTVFACFDYCEEIFLWGADYFSELLPEKNNGSWIVWDKREDKNGNNSDFAAGSCFELCWSKSKHKREIARVKWQGIYGTESQDIKSRIHPTQKPIQLSEFFFDKWGKEKKKIIDLYGGSGSTLIACEKTDRQCFMMELDPIYCGVILDRWQKFTGKKAHREDGVAWDEIKGGE